MKKVFELLRNIYEYKDINSDCFNEAKTKANELGYLDNNLNITKEGQDFLDQYRVDNAIILAAGMSTRFVPISYELPKGLISVKGEVLVERMIRQLHEAGVHEVVVVVGYMMEKFLYLRDNYNVKLVVNNEYSTKNTHSSIYAARDYLKNTYICCSDNYYPENPFHPYEYNAYYCSIFLPGISYVERAFTTDEDGLIIDTNIPSKNQWIMYGHAYYDANFSKNFKPILKSYYGRDGVENMYWENVYAENLAELPMYIKKCDPGEILEFDSMDELKVFDPDFIAHNNIKIFENICKVLDCEISDINAIEPISKGLNNRSFKFSCKGKNYVYRHPGTTAEGVIDRKKEAVSLIAASKLDIDSTFIHIDAESGWKISKHIEIVDSFDFSNEDHVRMLANHLRTLHQSKTSVGFAFDYAAEAAKLIDYIKFMDNSAYRSLLECRDKMQDIIRWLKEDEWQVSLCHNDIYEPNLLVGKDGLELIDWEFAGDSDIGYDICKLFTEHYPDFDSADKWLKYYYNRETTRSEKAHLFACAAVIYYYWFVWSVYENKTGGKSTGYMLTWHDKMIHFRNIVLEYLGGE